MKKPLQEKTTFEYANEEEVDLSFRKSNRLIDWVSKKFREKRSSGIFLVLKQNYSKILVFFLIKKKLFHWKS